MGRGAKSYIYILTKYILKVNAEVLARQWEGIVCRMGVAERREHQAAYKRCLAR